MPYFRKKPVLIKAVQLTWANWNEVCDLVGKKGFQDGFIGGVELEDGSFAFGTNAETRTNDASKIAAKIRTLEGTMIARQDDWIIEGVHGELYPCKPDIFDDTYEFVG